MIPETETCDLLFHKLKKQMVQALSSSMVSNSGMIYNLILATSIIVRKSFKVKCRKYLIRPMKSEDP